MSSDGDIIKVELNTNNNDKNIESSNNERVSVIFVDSIFKNVQNTSKEAQDPLNTKNFKFLEIQDNKNSNSDLVTPQKKRKNSTDTLKAKSSNKISNDIKTIKNTNKKGKYLNSASSAKNINNHNFSITDKKVRKPNKGMKNSYAAINEKYLAKQESEKEKRLYQQKVKLLENRILALKKHDEEMKRKKHCNEIRQNYLNKKKKEKYDFKQKLLSYDIDKRNALEEKRKAIKEQKLQLNNELKESMEKTKF